jgi:hypothetical protein
VRIFFDYLSGKDHMRLDNKRGAVYAKNGSCKVDVVALFGYYKTNLDTRRLSRSPVLKSRGSSITYISAPTHWQSR